MAGILDRVDRLRIGNPTNGTSTDEDDLSVEGDATIGGNLTVTGNITPSGNIVGNLTITGNLGVGGSARVTGAATFSNALDVTGRSVFSNTTKFSGRVELERGAIVSQGVLLAGEPTPLAGTVGLGNYVDVRAPATGRGTIVFPGSSVTSNAVWFKVFSGATDYYIPAFSSIFSRA